MKYKLIHLSKLDAVCSQIDTAIDLWFFDKDPISIHTLACSAYQVIHDFNQKKGWRDLLYDSLVVKDEFRNEIKNLLKKEYNFFKHADKDTDEVIEFNPEITELFIFFTCMGLELHNIPANKVRSAFIFYKEIMSPQALTEKGKERLSNAFSVDQLNEIKQLPKPAFYKAYIGDI